jgi:MFS family permease
MLAQVAAGVGFRRRASAMVLRGFFFAAGGICALLALGFLLDQAWAIWIWPFYSYRLAHIFIASVLLAVAAPVLLIGVHREWAALRGGAINLVVTFAIMAAFSLATARTDQVRLFGLVTAGFAVVQAALFVATRNTPFNDLRPTPRPVLWAFAGFAAILVAVGLALLFAVPNVLPWPVTANVSVLYGAVFLGAAAYFVYGLFIPIWGNARGQLAGFLAYDLVLIGPFLGLLPSVPDRWRLSLTLYLSIVIVSGLLAAFYLVRGPQSAAARRQAAST